jgi:hypothetical protein
MDAFQELREFWGNSLVTWSVEELKKFPFSEETRGVLTKLGLPMKEHPLLSRYQEFFFHDRFQSLMFNGREFVSIGYMTVESVRSASSPPRTGCSSCMTWTGENQVLFGSSTPTC